LIGHAVRRIAAAWPASPAHDALAASLITRPAAMTETVRQRLHALVARYA
jgi:hypothetical protein